MRLPCKNRLWFTNFFPYSFLSSSFSLLSLSSPYCSSSPFSFFFSLSCQNKSIYIIFARIGMGVGKWLKWDLTFGAWVDNSHNNSWVNNITMWSLLIHMVQSYMFNTYVFFYYALTENTFHVKIYIFVNFFEKSY